MGTGVFKGVTVGLRPTKSDEDGWQAEAPAPRGRDPLTGSAGVMSSPQQLNRYSYAVNNPFVFRDPAGLGCTTVQAYQLLTQAVGQTQTQNILDQLAQNDPQGLRQIRDQIANSNVTQDLNSSKWSLVTQLNIALIGAPSSGLAAPPPAPANPGTFTPQEVQRSQQFLNSFSSGFGGPPVSAPAPKP